MKPAPPPRPFLWYGGYVVVWTLVIVAGGAILGALAFPLVGAMAGAQASAGALAVSGARQLGFLSFVWAPAVAIVMAFNRAYLARSGRAR